MRSTARSPHHRICVKVGSVTACCLNCGDFEFRVVDENRGALSRYRCCTCMADTTRTQLLLQISEKVVERSREILQAL